MSSGSSEERADMQHLRAFGQSLQTNSLPLWLVAMVAAGSRSERIELPECKTNCCANHSLR